MDASHAGPARFDAPPTASFAWLPVPVMILSPDLVVRDANDALCALTGATPEQIIGRAVLGDYPENDEAQRVFREAYDRALAGEPQRIVRQLYRLRDSGGALRDRYWTVSIRGFHADGGTGPGPFDRLFVVTLDVTAEVMAEQMRDAVTREMQHRVGNLFTPDRRHGAAHRRRVGGSGRLPRPVRVARHGPGAHPRDADRRRLGRRAGRPAGARGRGALHRRAGRRADGPGGPRCA